MRDPTCVAPLAKHQLDLEFGLSAMVPEPPLDLAGANEAPYRVAIAAFELRLEVDEFVNEREELLS